MHFGSISATMAFVQAVTSAATNFTASSSSTHNWTPATSTLNSTYTFCSDQGFCFTQAKQLPGFSGCKKPPPNRQGNITLAAGVTCVFWQSDNCYGSPFVNKKSLVWTLNMPGTWRISSSMWTTKSFNCMLQTDWDSAEAAGAMQNDGVLGGQFANGVLNIPAYP